MPTKKKTATKKTQKTSTPARTRAAARTKTQRPAPEKTQSLLYRNVSPFTVALVIGFYISLIIWILLFF